MSINSEDKPNRDSGFVEPGIAVLIRQTAQMTVGVDRNLSVEAKVIDNIRDIPSDMISEL